MDETLLSLEQKRDNLYQQLQETGDFRRGTISVNSEVLISGIPQ